MPTENEMMNVILERAKNGNLKDMVSIAELYNSMENKEEAVFWLKKAVEKNCPQAMNSLANIYVENHNMIDAINLYEKSAALNDIGGYIGLITHAISNNERKQLIIKAEKIAETKDSEQLIDFGKCLRKYDAKKAIKWFEKAYKQGNKTGKLLSEIIILSEDFEKKRAEFIVADIVPKIIAKDLDLNESEISEDADLESDLGADDLDMWNIIYETEEILNIEIPDEEIFIEEDIAFPFKTRTVKEYVSFCKKIALEN